MSTTSPYPSSQTSDDYYDDDDDVAAYKMESFGTIPTVKPSREVPVPRRKGDSVETTPSAIVCSGIAAFPPASPTEFTIQMEYENEDENDSIHNLPFLVSPKSKGSRTSEDELHGTTVAPPSDNHLHTSTNTALQNSNISLDIIVEARTDEPQSRRDVFYLSTETFPTTNVYSASSPTSPTTTNNNNNNEPQNRNRREGMRMRNNPQSINTLPASNSSNSESHLTALLSIGDTTTSDLTTTTSGTFNTSNAVIMHEIQEGEDNHDNPIGDIQTDNVVDTNTNDIDNREGVLLHITTDENDIPLEELFASAQRLSVSNILYSNPQEDEEQPEKYDINIDHSHHLDVVMETDPLSSPRSMNKNQPNKNSFVRPPSTPSSSALHDLESPLIPSTESRSRGTPSLSTGSSVAISSLALTNSNSNDTPLTGGGVSSLSSHGSPVETKKNNENVHNEQEEETESSAAVGGEGAATTSAVVLAMASMKTESKTEDLPLVHTGYFSDNRYPQSPRIPYKLYFCRSMVIGIVLVIVILSASLFYTRDSRGTYQVSAPSSPTNPTTQPTSMTIQPQPIEVSQSPTLAPSSPRTEIFEVSAVFEGQGDDQRFGTVVSLSSTGDVMTALSLDPIEPVRTFMIQDNTGWLPLSILSVEGSSSTSTSSLESTMDVSVAITAEGLPAVAVSTAVGVQVFEYHQTEWMDRGQIIRWQHGDPEEEEEGVDPIASSTATSLSSDASVLAAGYISESGRSLVVRVFAFDVESKLWYQRGDTIRRDRLDGVSPFLSLVMALSGDGAVISVGDWLLGTPQVVLETYHWKGTQWRPMGAPISLPWGPVSVTLSRFGTRMAHVDVASGTAFEWNGTQWNVLGTGFVGGTSLSMSGDGTRLVVGDALQGIATVLDYESDVWRAGSVLRGAYLSRFGESVAISEDGNTISVGSPLDDQDGTNFGQVLVFT